MQIETLELHLFFKALADNNRLRVVHALLQHEELCACQLTEMLEISSATTSRHMDVLIAAHLVERRRKSRWAHYSLNKDHFAADFLAFWIKAMAVDNPQIQQDINNLERIIANKSLTECQKEPSKGKLK